MKLSRRNFIKSAVAAAIAAFVPKAEEIQESDAQTEQHEPGASIELKSGYVVPVYDLNRDESESKKWEAVGQAAMGGYVRGFDGSIDVIATIRARLEARKRAREMSKIVAVRSGDPEPADVSVDVEVSIGWPGEFVDFERYYKRTWALSENFDCPECTKPDRPEWVPPVNREYANPGKSWWIAEDGDDNNSGLDPDHPRRTLDDVIMAASAPTDVIFVLPGDGTQSVILETPDET